MFAYHGSSYHSVIKKFKKSKSGYLGSSIIYFTNNMKIAYDYAVKEYGSGKLYTVELLVRNPLVIPPDIEPVDFIVSPAIANRRRNTNSNCNFWLKGSDYNKFQKRGYDAVIYKDEIGVFDNSQILVKDVIDVSMF